METNMTVAEIVASLTPEELVAEIERGQENLDRMKKRVELTVRVLLRLVGQALTDNETLIIDVDERVLFYWLLARDGHSITLYFEGLIAYSLISYGHDDISQTGLKMEHIKLAHGALPALVGVLKSKYLETLSGYLFHHIEAAQVDL